MEAEASFLPDPMRKAHFICLSVVSMPTMILFADDGRLLSEWWRTATGGDNIDWELGENQPFACKEPNRLS